MEHPRKKSETVAIQIEKSILNGAYRPGDRLPAERDLAEEYGVSRSILREAMKHIAGMGLVRTEPQSGTYVTDYGKEASLELLVYLMDNNETLNPDILVSLLDFREVLETGAAERAAARGDTAFLEDLAAKLAAMSDARNDPVRLSLQDYAFHARIIEQTGNIAFRLLFNACRSVYLLYARRFYALVEHTDRTFGQLEDLIEAFRAGDPARAAAIMRSILTYGQESMYEDLNISIPVPAKSFGGNHGTQ